MKILRNVFYQYGTNTSLNLEDPNSVLIKNTGDVKAFVNGFPLNSGEVFSSNMVQGDMIDKTQYRITFDPNGVGNKLVNVIASFVSQDKNEEINSTNNGTSC